jgi:hypothetical protein
MVALSGNAIGCLISIFGSVLGNVGLNIEKLAHTRNQRKPLKEQVSYVLLPLWWMGLTGVIIGAICDLLSLGYATQTLSVASGGATTLLSNCFVSRCMHGETMRCQSYVGVFMIIAGAIFFASATPPSKEYAMSELEGFAFATDFLMYCVAMTAMICTTLSLVATSSMYVHRTQGTFALLAPLVRQMQWNNHEMKEHINHMKARVDTLESALDITFQFLQSKHPEAQAEFARIRTSLSREASINRQYSLKDKSNEVNGWYDAPIYALCSGMVGSVSVLLASCAMKTIMWAIAQKTGKTFLTFSPYLFIGGMLTTVITQTHFLNCALELGDISTIFPVFQAIWIGFGVVGGMIFYDLWGTMDNQMKLVHFFGVVLLVLGTLVMVHNER